MRGSPAPRGPSGDAAGREARSAGPREALGFVGRFGLGWAVGVLATIVVPDLQRWLIEATVASLAVVLRAVSPQYGAAGAHVLIGSHALEITPDCTPLMPTIALWSGMAAFPAPGRWKLAGAIGGVAALWIYDVIRVLAVALVLEWHPRWYDFVHVFLWQTMTVVVVFGLFLLWLRLEPRPRDAG